MESYFGNFALRMTSLVEGFCRPKVCRSHSEAKLRACHLCLEGEHYSCSIRELIDSQDLFHVCSTTHKIFFLSKETIEAAFFFVCFPWHIHVGLIPACIYQTRADVFVLEVLAPELE